MMEKRLIRFFGVLGPWLAPLATAYVVYRATMEQLGYPWPVAALIAFFFEVIGVVSVVTVIEFWQYNQSKRVSDKHMPVAVAAFAAGSYLLATITFAVLLDVIPQLARVAPALFPLLTIVAGLNIGLRHVYDLEIGRQESERQKRAAARKTSKQANKPATERKPVPVAEIPQKTENRLNGQNGRVVSAPANGQVSILKNGQAGDHQGVSDWRLLPVEYQRTVRDVPAKTLAERHGIGASTARRWRQTSRGMK